jgi:predicted RNA-binding Zn-ribbon protein involved in translation (DUF1610 family)
MDLGENLSNSFEYVKKLFSDVGRLVILIILDIVPIVNWIVVGYAARVLKESPGPDSPPKLENYGELLVTGAKVFFASLIYMIIPIVLVLMGVGFSVLGGGAFSAQASGMLLGGTGILIALVGVILAILLLIVLGVGMAHMVKTGKFSKAFAFSEIFSIIRGIGWVKYLGWIVVVIIVAAVVGAIGSIPLVGWLISLVISPILCVFIFRSMGLLYNDGAPPELRSQAVASASGSLVCVSCGAALQPFHKFCPSCGAAAPAPPTQAPASTSEETKFCVSCGAKIPASAQFCGSCGAKQN